MSTFQAEHTKNSTLDLDDTALEKARQRVVINKEAARSILQSGLNGSGDTLTADDLSTLNHYMRRTGEVTRELNRKHLQRIMLDRISGAKERSKENTAFVNQLAREMKDSVKAMHSSVPNLRTMERYLDRLVDAGAETQRLAGILRDTAQELDDGAENTDYYEGMFDPMCGISWNDGSREVLQKLVGDIVGVPRPDVVRSIQNAIPTGSSWSDGRVDVTLSRTPSPPTDLPDLSDV